MKVAITGSTGFIGMALSSRLAADGHQLVRVVRSPIGSNEATTVWNPTTGRIDPAGFEDVDAVVNLAGEGIGDKRWSAHHKRMITQSRVDSTRLLAETLAGLDAGPRVLVNGSAIGFYGDRGDEVVDEQSPPGDLFLTEVVEAWEAAAKPAIDVGIRTVFARTGVVLAPNGGALAKLLPLFRIGLGGPMGSGRQWMSWITIDDEVSAIAWLLDHDIDGPVNLVAPNPVTNAELTGALGRALQRPVLVRVPSIGPKLLFGEELAHELLFAGQRVHPTVLEANGFVFEHQDIDTALRHLLRRERASI